MGGKRNTAMLRGVTVDRTASRAWAVTGAFSDGSSSVLARVGEGEGEPRGEAVLHATAEALASTLLLIYRERELSELGLVGKIAHASVDYDAGDEGRAPAYRAVTLRHGRRVERFATGEPDADWLAMQARSREVAAMLLLSPACHGFVEDVPGWRIAESGALEPAAEDAADPSGAPVSGR